MNEVEISYTSKFVKNYKRLDANIRSKAKQRIEVFQIDPYNPVLKTHKLTGQLNKFCSFSINYSYRILFAFENSNQVTFIDVGTHSIYR
ncbi:hypothetical protein COV25_02005 [candidate division WWE3 bacterium CG10_big_fil_rev_8_21_14_0_10_35_32]|nr:MAG: hypothetical protein COV25_02005 [candidate division WWE3 bacterium CG10_big_fil_rev_8_21_14_0_10_35_32]